MNIEAYQTAKAKPDKQWEQIEVIQNYVGDKLKLSLGSNKRQRVKGFGGAFTESSAYVLSKLSVEKQQRILESYFSPNKGIGYTFGRTHMNSCDFSLENYAAAQRAGDVNLDYFDTTREETSIWKMILEAQNIAGKKIPLLLSPWSPPAWMKSNGSMNNGGYLLPEYYLSWANYYPKYLNKMKDFGLNVFAITLQNEPEATQTWDSCRYTGVQEGEFIANYLGPTLKREGVEVDIYALDHNRDILYKRVQDVTSVDKATNYLKGFAIHWYSGSDFIELEKTKGDFPNFDYIFSEGCVEGGVKIGQWDRGERYAHNIIGDFNAGISLWLDWNILLDQNGGPNHVGNFCDAPVIGNILTDDVIYQNSYVYIGHFSKFIKTDAHIVSSELSGQGSEFLETLGAINKDGSRVCVLLNRSVNSLLVEVDFGQVVNIEPNSITTVIIK
jgi:glucosylceramidase